MKIAVIGLGSMGKRRIRLLKQAFPEIKLIGIDRRLDRREEVEQLFRIECVTDLVKLSHEKLEAVIISTSPLTHEHLIKQALEMGAHVFTEINLINDYYEEVMTLSEKQKLHLYLSSTFLHRREVQYLESKIEQDKHVSYRYHVGQYLPDWHPWESYKDYFVSNKSTNGCREIFAIELPWISSVFGEITSVKVSRSKISTLDIDFPDSYSLILEHKSGIIGTLDINIVSRIAKRELQIIGENTQIEWGGTPDSLSEWSRIDSKQRLVKLYDIFNNNSNYSANIIEDAYQEELIEFISLIRNDIQDVKYSFARDKKIIDWINFIEEGI